MPLTPIWMSSQNLSNSRRNLLENVEHVLDIPEVSEEQAVAVGIDVHHEIAIDDSAGWSDLTCHCGLGKDMAGKLCNPRIDLRIGRVLRLELEQPVHRDGQALP